MSDAKTRAAAALAAQAERGNSDPLNEVKMEAICDMLPSFLESEGFAIVMVRKINGGVDGMALVGGDMPRIETMRALVDGIGEVGRGMGIGVNIKQHFIPVAATPTH